jgi:hypothetical protein
MFIAALDFENLDNPVFLKTFAEALRQFPNQKAIIVHGDSAYTDRLMQTGMMREDAILRSIQDLNHRLVSFFADYGIACIGINGFQRGTICANSDGNLEVNIPFLESLPERTIAVISNLVLVKNTEDKKVVPLPEVAKLLAEKLTEGQIFIFSTDKKDHISMKISDELPKKIQFDEISSKKHEIGVPEQFISSSGNYILCKPLFNSDLKSFEMIAFLKI